MKIAALLFPHQLVKQPGFWHQAPVFFLVEEYLFFRQYRFHKQKLVFHRASMKQYAAYCQQNGKEVTYVESTTPASDIRVLIKELAASGYEHILYMDTTDNWLEKRIRESAARYGLTLEQFPSPLFLNAPEVGDAFFSQKKTYFQTDFYIAQRKQRNVLMEKNGKPLGGQWSFDADNRVRYPRKATPPKVHFPPADAFVQEAQHYVTTHFPDHPGEASPFFYPTRAQTAQDWLADFFQHRFAEFGPYEDAMVSSESILHHSLISPLLNTGLLEPQDVLDQALAYAQKNKVPLNSLEGLVRQIMGWREFIRIVYEREGTRQRTQNYWGHQRKIPREWWTGETGMVPVDTVIKRLLKTGYCHHIERLMVLGNFMLLCEFDPDEVYRWFMEMFIDSYDWVMVPNVYGMTQFADGGLMTTKPYISGSNYLMKMGDWEKGPWQEVWDGLFWRFMHVHRDFFTRNPRLGMLINTFDKMPAEKRNKHLQVAESYLDRLDQGGS